MLRMNRCRWSEAIRVRLFISAAPETGDENRVPRAAQVDGSDAFMAHGHEFRHFTGHTFFFKFPAEGCDLRDRLISDSRDDQHRIAVRGKTASVIRRRRPPLPPTNTASGFGSSRSASGASPFLMCRLEQRNFRRFSIMSATASGSLSTA